MEHKYPKTKKVDFKENLHGINVRDSYRWLEEDNREVSDWVDGQNNLTTSYLDKVSVRGDIRKRLEQLFELGSFSNPLPKGGKYFFMERHGKEELASLYVQDGVGGSPRILIDPSKLSKDKTITARSWYPSNSGRFVAYGLSDAGNDRASIYVMDVESGENLKDVLPGDTYPAVHSKIEWDIDDSGFWYSRRYADAPKNEAKFHQKIYYHKLGDGYRNDKMVFGDNISKADLPELSISRDGRWKLVSVSVSNDCDMTELYLFDNRNPNKGFIKIIEGSKDVVFNGFIHSDRIFMITNYKAPLWKIISIKIEDAEKGIDAWNDVIPESKLKLEYFDVVRDRIFVETLKDIVSEFNVYNLGGNLISSIKLPSKGSLGAFSSDHEGDELFFGFTSFLIPYTVYRYDLNSNSYDVFKKVSSSIDADDFLVSQEWCLSKDGTKVPMFIVYKKGLVLNGHNMAFLEAYGGFGTSMMPGFDRTIIPFLERGGVYVLANIRGGGEFGEKWHFAGRRTNKQNAFNDFIASAEYLISKKYTNSGRLAIFGWSNGGLLISAMIAQRPDLFRVAIVGAPVVDMLRFHKFFGGLHWVSEYGSPDVSDDFKYLIKYSPYHNIKYKDSYPATLIVAADKDDRVHPAHAYKLAAKLQECNNSLSPIFLRVEKNAGHSGASSAKKTAERFADIYAFIFKELE